MEVLKQPQFSPLPMAAEMAILFVAVNGHLMDIAKDKVAPFIRGFLEFLSIHHKELMETITKTGGTTIEIEKELNRAVENCKQLKQQG
jgi:F-type H+-transporting ATPase subunit alpha